MHYYHSGSKRRLSADEVREKDKETQIDIMRDWFHDNFEVTSEPTRYMNGEYFYITGNPYNSYEVLEEEFDNIVPEDVILILAEELCTTDWDPTPYGNYSDSTGCRPLEQFDESMKNINILLSTEFHNTSSYAVSLMRRLLYANIIIAIEVYLSDTFKNKIIYDDSAIRYFVETFLVFKEKKNSISDISNNKDNIKNRVNNYLTMFCWHRLKETKKMYENTFGIKFPENMKTINKAVRIRHDIIHRNGKIKDDESHEINETDVRDFIDESHKINETDVRDLIDEAQKFVACIEDQMYEKSSYTATEHTPSIFDLD